MWEEAHVSKGRFWAVRLGSVILMEMVVPAVSTGTWKVLVAYPFGGDVVAGVVAVGEVEVEDAIL